MSDSSEEPQFTQANAALLLMWRHLPQTLELNVREQYPQNVGDPEFSLLQYGQYLILKKTLLPCWAGARLETGFFPALHFSR